MKAIWLEFNLAKMGLARFFGKTNRHAFWGPLSPVRYGDIAAPELPGEQWVRCRTIMGGLCGSDLSAIQLRQPIDSIIRPHVSYPMLLGHENIAEVIEVGAQADPAWIGKRVCVDPTLACEQRGVDPPCRACRAGRYGACENFSQPDGLLPPGLSIGYNSRTGGSWGEQFVAHQSRLFELPDSIDNEVAILVDPMACAMHAVLRAMPEDDDQVLIVGAGAIGLGVVACLRALGSNARIIIDARHEFQAEAAVRLGANQAVQSGRPGSAGRFEHLAEYAGARVATGMFGGRVLSGGFDIVYDCVGSAATVQDSIRTVRAGGKVVLLGTSAARNVDWTGVWFREVEVFGAYGRQVETWGDRQIDTYALVIELIAQGKLKCDGLLTHTYRLADYRQAFAAATAKRGSGVIKAAFVFESGQTQS